MSIQHVTSSLPLGLCLEGLMYPIIGKVVDAVPVKFANTRGR